MVQLIEWGLEDRGLGLFPFFVFVFYFIIIFVFFIFLKFRYELNVYYIHELKNKQTQKMTHNTHKVRKMVQVSSIFLSS